VSAFGLQINELVRAALTPAERKVALQLLEGSTTLRMAKQLKLSQRTIKSHMTAMFRKCHIDGGGCHRIRLARILIGLPDTYQETFE
jgi:DNA-binding CsgD family transcriptional regulator